MSEIIAKRVTMLELFFDLVFVCAISRIAHMLQHLEHGRLDWSIYVMFLSVCVTILGVWFYQSVYINKYGQESMADTIGLCVTMFGAIYTATSINTEWHTTFYTFNFSMAIMCASMAFQFYNAHRRLGQAASDALHFCYTLAVQTMIILISLALGFTIGIWIAMLSYVFTIIIWPLIAKNLFSPHNINFPHLVERSSLITIILFGEMIVTIVNYFDPQHITPLPALIFTGVVFLFGCYVYCVEYLMDHHQITRGFMVMYPHFLIFVGILTLLSGWSYDLLPEVSEVLVAEMLILGLSLFLGGTYCLSVYFKKNITLNPQRMYSLLTVTLLAFVGIWFGQIQWNLYLVNACIAGLAISHFLFIRQLRPKTEA